MSNTQPSIILPIVETRPGYNRTDELRVALVLTYITLGWMTIEGGASLILGWRSKSLLLEAFGIDSVVELFSAAVLLWRLRVEAGGDAGIERVESVERRAAKLVGYTLYVLPTLIQRFPNREGTTPSFCSTSDRRRPPVGF